MGKYYHEKRKLVLSTQWQGKKKKKTGWLHSKGTVYLCTLSNIFKHSKETLKGNIQRKHSKETLQQSIFDDATMCHIYKFKWAELFGYSGLILLFGRKMIIIR
jgi:hypothetical protein